MKNRKLKGLMLVLLLSIELFAQNLWTVEAASVDKIVHVYCKNGAVYALTNAQGLSQESVSCQIDQTDCPVAKVDSLENAKLGVRTICLIDVSKSVTTNDKKQIKSMLKSLIQSMGENEQMEIESIGQDRNIVQEMTGDKFKLYSAYEDIKYEKQPTYITKIIPDLIEDVKQSIEADNCFYRLIVFSDDYRDNTGTLSSQALLDSLKDSPMPIYTIGCLHEDNAEQLKNFYDFSSLTGGKSFTIQEKTKLSKIVKKLNEFYQDTAIMAKVPEELRDGSVRKVSYIIKGKEENSKKLVASVTTEKSPQKENSLSVESTLKEPVKQPTFFEKYKLVILIGSGVFVCLVGVGVYLLIRKKRNDSNEMTKSKGISPEVIAQTGKDLLPNYETKVQMDFMDIEDDYDRTVAITKPASKNAQKVSSPKAGKHQSWHVKLNDVNNNRVFEKEIDQEIYLGRTPSRDGKDVILVNYDPSVSKLHCRIYIYEDELYIEDLDSLNGTFVNGVAVEDEMKLSNQDIIDVGQVKFKVSFDKR